MRDSIGSTWIFAIIISFTMIFAGFLVLALNYAKAYRAKNEMTTIIEKYEGLTTTDKENRIGSIQIMNQFLKNNKYNSKGRCTSDDYSHLYGVNDLDATTLIKIDDDDTSLYYYCLKYEANAENCTVLYYITVFFDFNLPILDQLGKFAIKGQTNEVQYGRFLDKYLVCYSNSAE